LNAGGEKTIANMTLQIDDAFIRKWEPIYDDPQIGGDDEDYITEAGVRRKGYKTLVTTVAREMNSTGTISKSTFLDIWVWKGAMRVIGLTRIYVEGQKTVTAEEDEYETRYAPAFRRAASAPPERKLAELLADGMKLPGVGAPTGSTLLHFIHSETMPIVDVRTVETLFAAGLISTELRELETYEEFRRAIDEIRRRCPGWTLRQIDRALFAYHKQVLDAGRGQPVFREAATSREDLEAAFASAPVCWTYSSAKPRYLYFSVDNKSTTKAAFRFPFAEVAGMLVRTKTTYDYTYWELAKA
jgi:hypothetical protein